MLRSKIKLLPTVVIEPEKELVDESEEGKED